MQQPMVNEIDPQKVFDSLGNNLQNIRVTEKLVYLKLLHFTMDCHNFVKIN